MPIEATHLVDDVMRQWPATIRVFLSHRMRCVGCPIACFHTVDDACREHGTHRAEFLKDLRAAAEETASEIQGESGVVPARWPEV
jgi:hybrid cluster-associated redox disulfide protein